MENKLHTLIIVHNRDFTNPQSSATDITNLVSKDTLPNLDGYAQTFIEKHPLGKIYVKEILENEMPKNGFISGKEGFVDFADWYERKACEFAQTVCGEVVEKNINHFNDRLDVHERASLANDLIKQNGLQGKQNTTVIKGCAKHLDDRTTVIEGGQIDGNGIWSIENSVLQVIDPSISKKPNLADIQRLTKIYDLLREKFPNQSILLYTGKDNTVVNTVKKILGDFDNQCIERKGEMGNWLLEQTFLRNYKSGRHI